MHIRIGELARRTGLAPSRIRFYERVGLLTVVERRANGYRTYPPQAALVLELIVTAQQAGFSLDEIRTLLPTDLAQWPHEPLLDTLRGKVGDIEALQARLAQNKAYLLALIDEIEAKPQEIDCATNAQRLLSQIRSGEMPGPASATGDMPSPGRPGRHRPTDGLPS